MFEAYNIVLEHFFLYNIPYIVYNPKSVQGEDENNHGFVPDS